MLARLANRIIKSEDLRVIKDERLKLLVGLSIKKGNILKGKPSEGKEQEVWIEICGQKRMRTGNICLRSNTTTKMVTTGLQAPCLPTVKINNKISRDVCAIGMTGLTKDEP